MSVSEQLLPRIDEQPRAGSAYVRLTGAATGESTVAQRLTTLARTKPGDDAIAWLAPGGARAAMTWEQLSDMAHKVGVALVGLTGGVGRVGVLGRDRRQWAVAFYGAACCGCGVVPLQPDPKPDILAARCRQAGVDIILVTDESPFASVDHIGKVRIVRVGALMGGPVDGRAAAGFCAASVARTRPDDPFLYQFTSGTTGVPKLAVLSHRAVLGSAEWYVRGAGGQDGDTLFNPLPLEHVGGSVAGLIGALTIGGTYVAIAKFDVDTVVPLVNTMKPALVGVVPTMIIDLVDSGKATPQDFASVRSVVGGATRVDPGIIDRIENDLDIVFLVAYGQSEAPCMTMSGVDDPQWLRTRTIGRPLPGRDYCIAGPDGVADEGEIGELCVRGPLIMSGYLGEDGKLVSVTDSDGWMRTGDLCSLTDGVITFHSRLRDVVIRGGENLYPAEIEPVLSAFPAVSEVSVFGLPDRRLGERLVAAVRVAPGAEVDTAELDSFAAERLPRRSRPTQWFVVEDFPRTSTGKIRKPVLREQFL